MLRFSLLGSGSSGNAALVLSPCAKVLIDSGFSLRQLEKRVAAVGESLDGLDAVFVTHEHRDHVGGLGVLARRRKIPVYLTEETCAALPSQVGEIPDLRCFESGEVVRIGDLEVASFGISHDAADPVGYTVSCDGAKMGFASDMGRPSQLVRARLAGCRALVLEANYCPELLRSGSYPPQVQQRIRSRIGHLSNQDMSSLLSELFHEGLDTIVLMHISENNNCPDRVRRMAEGVVRDRDVRLHLAEQDAPTPIFEVRP